MCFWRCRKWPTQHSNLRPFQPVLVNCCYVFDQVDRELPKSGQVIPFCDLPQGGGWRGNRVWGHKARQYIINNNDTLWYWRNENIGTCFLSVCVGRPGVDVSFKAVTTHVHRTACVRTATLSFNLSLSWWIYRDIYFSRYRPALKGPILADSQIIEVAV